MSSLLLSKGSKLKNIFAFYVWNTTMCTCIWHVFTCIIIIIVIIIKLLFVFLFSGVTEVDVEEGDISVGSASGKLKAVTNHGNIDVNLAHNDDVTLKSKEGILLCT